MGFHIHTQRMQTHFLSHMYCMKQILTSLQCTCGKCIVSLSEIWHCRPLCPRAIWEDMHIQRLYEHILQWLSSKNAFLEMIFMFSCLCETGMRRLMCISFPLVWTSRPLLCINRRRMSARERPKTKEKRHWICKCHIWKSTVWVSGMGERVFPDAPYTQKHIHLHFSLWSRMHHLFFFFFSTVLKMPECLSHRLIFLLFTYLCAHPFCTIKLGFI